MNDELVEVHLLPSKYWNKHCTDYIDLQFMGWEEVLMLNYFAHELAFNVGEANSVYLIRAC